MIEFGYILIIIFETILAIIIIFALMYLEHKVKCLLWEINIEAENLLTSIKNVKMKLQTFNENFDKIKKIDIDNLKQGVVLVLDIINFVLLIKSMNLKTCFTKGFLQKQGLKWCNVRKLIPFSVIKKLLAKI